MHPTTCRIALKEWAVTVDAVARGEQIVLLRKGGLRDGRSFRVEHERFLFYPGYLHQSADLLKPDYRSRLAEMATDPDDHKLTMAVYAEVSEVLRVSGEDAVASLEPFHIWAPGYALKRVHWKPRSPLHVMLLRAYRLRSPATVPVLPEYGGCTSWVELDRPAPLGELEPVLTGDEFAARADGIRRTLSAAVKS